MSTFRRRSARKAQDAEDILSPAEREEYDGLMYDAGHDEHGNLLPSGEIKERMHGLLLDAVQAGRTWAQFVLDDDAREGHLKRHKRWRDRKEFVSTAFGGGFATKPAAMSIRRVSTADASAVWQPTLWQDMTRAELLQIVTGSQMRARAEQVTISIARRLIALLDETGAESVSTALEAKGTSIDEFLLDEAA